MKILFYINAIHHGGAERVMVNLAKEISDRGIECILVTSFYDTWEYPLDKKVQRISLFDEKLNDGFFKKNVKLVSKLRKVISLEKPDLVLSFMAEPNFRALLASIGLKNKTIISVRNDPEKEYPSFLFRCLAKSLYLLADGVVFQTKDAQAWFSKKIREKSTIIYNPIESVFYNSVYKGNRKNIVTTGRLTEQKNHKLLIDAFHKIAEKVDDNLYIYGEGELRGQLEHQINELNLTDRCFLPGATHNIPQAINSARLFVLSSDYEGMPNSLMEAMAMQIPCISTDCPSGGPRELMGTEGEKYLVPVGNAAGLSKLMLEVLTSENETMRNIRVMEQQAECFETNCIIERWYRYFVEIMMEE